MEIDYNKNLRVGYDYLLSHDEMNELNTDRPSGRIIDINYYQMVLSLGKEWSWSDFWFIDRKVTIKFKRQPVFSRETPNTHISRSWFANDEAYNRYLTQSLPSTSKANPKRDEDTDWRKRDNDDYFLPPAIYDSSPSWSNDTSFSSDDSPTFGGGDFGGGGAEGSYDSGSSDSGGGDGGSSD